MAGIRKTGSSRLRHGEGVCGCGLLLKHLMTEVKVVRLSEREEMMSWVRGWAETRRGCEGETGFWKHMEEMLGGGWFVTVVAAILATSFGSNCQ